MSLHRTFRIVTTGAMCLAVAASPGWALVSFNDGRDKIFVTGSTSFAWNSNIFAHNGGGGDYIMSAGLASEYSRRAGLIGVDAGVAVNASRFNTYSTEDFKNPSLHLELSKQSGRTTGSLALGAARESRADSAANIREQSWFYSAGLNLKYPVIERYSLSGGLSGSSRKFQDATALVDLTTYAANIDLFYVFTSDRDLIAGYRYRVENSSAHTKSIDQSLTFGVSGRIIPRLNGSVRGGYQVRKTLSIYDSQYASWTSSAAVTWSATKRVSVSGSLSKDFSTTSTDLTTDTLSANLDAQFSYSAKLSANAGLGWSDNRFLGTSGDGREDTSFSYNLGLSYRMNDHLSLALTYSYSRNWSTLDYADFARSGLSLSLSSRW
jgi:outer membrane receptor protein involved in Fe transport